MNDIPDKSVLQFDPAVGLTIGAAVPWRHIGDHPCVNACYPCLAMVAHLICSASPEERPTLGDSVCVTPVDSDSLPPLIAMEAVCDLAGPDGRRVVPVERLWAAGGLALGPDETLVSVHLPVPPLRTGVWYIPFYLSDEMEVVFVRAAASLVLSEGQDIILAARVALGAAAPTPLFLDTVGAVLVGQAPSEAILNTAAALARVAVRSSIAEAGDDTAQRVHAAGFLTRRALRFALLRIRKGTQCDLWTEPRGACVENFVLE